MSDLWFDGDDTIPFVMRFRAQHIKPMTPDDVRRFMTGPSPREARRLYRQETR